MIQKVQSMEKWELLKNFQWKSDEKMMSIEYYQSEMGDHFSKYSSPHCMWYGMNSVDLVKLQVWPWVSLSKVPSIFRNIIILETEHNLFFSWEYNYIAPAFC